MRKFYSLLIIGLLVLMVGFLLYGCRSKEVESALIYINQQKDWDKAMEQLQIAVQINPGDLEAHVLLAEGYGQFSDYEKMVNEFDISEKLMANAPNPTFQNKITTLRDQYWRICFNKGVKNAKADSLDAAKVDFENCIVIDAKRPESYKNLAYVNVRLDDFDEAIRIYNEALKIDPKDNEALTSLANLYFNKKQYEKSVEICDRILAITPDNVEATAQKAMSYDFLNDSEKAFQAYEEALAKEPNNKDLIFNLGRLYYQKKNYEKAIENFTKVLEAAPDDFEANINIGNAYLLEADSVIKKYRDMNDKQIKKVQKEFEADTETSKEFSKNAIPYLEKAVVLSPDNQLAWYNLAVAYVRGGESTRGEACFKISEEAEQGNFLKATDFIDKYLSHLKN